MTIKNLIAPFCDEDFDLDIFRIVGFIAYSGAIVIAFKTVSLALTELPTEKLAIVAALVISLSTVGTLLFSQARKGDASRIDARNDTYSKEP
jgi:hypothetical protein